MSTAVFNSSFVIGNSTSMAFPSALVGSLLVTGATIAAENGATEHQLMAIFGWASARQAAIYTRKANRTRLAADAMHLLMPKRTERGR